MLTTIMALMNGHNKKGELKLGENINGGNIVSNHPILTNLAALLTISAFIGAGITWLDVHYAKEKNLIALECRLQTKVLGDRFWDIQKRIWGYEKRIQENPTDITAKEELKRLEIVKNNIDKQIDILRKQMARLRSESRVGAVMADEAGAHP